jgi:hypothetical protein
VLRYSPYAGHPTGVVSGTLRSICLTLPHAEETILKRGPTYRIRGKIFAMERSTEDTASVWCRAPRQSRQVLIEGDPDRYFVPPLVGISGWVGVRLGDEFDWQDVAFLIRRSYRLVAPRRLATLVP